MDLKTTSTLGVESYLFFTIGVQRPSCILGIGLAPQPGLRSHLYTSTQFRFTQYERPGIPSRGRGLFSARQAGKAGLRQLPVRGQWIDIIDASVRPWQKLRSISDALSGVRSLAVLARSRNVRCAGVSGKGASTRKMSIQSGQKTTAHFKTSQARYVRSLTCLPFH